MSDIERHTPGEMQFSEVERDRVVAALRHHVGEGTITLDEFSDRVGLVYGARTSGELERVVADLPAIAADPAVPASPRRVRKAVRWVVSFFGGNQQRGRWRIEGDVNAVAVMGGCNLDLREAEVVGDEATITAFAFMGGVDIVVPEGIEVVLEGFAFMGGKSLSVKDAPIIPGSPLIRVRAYAFMGGVSVRSKPPRSRGDRAARKRARDRQRHRHGAVLADPPATRVAPPRGIEAVADSVAEDWRELRRRVAPEGTVTILFSDIEGFSTTTELLGDMRAQELLRGHYRIVRTELERHRGFEVKVQGDGFMVAFDSAARAVRCAADIQRAQEAWNREHPEVPLHVRMGLHTGEAIRDADDFLGSTVNLASRIASSAHGGEIRVSALLRELCASSGEFEFEGPEEVALRGLSGPHRVYRVRWS